jgi:N-acetylglucosamine kinase-like BadF-type ATPase
MLSAMTRDQGLLRGVEIRLLLSAPTVDGVRLDDLSGDSPGRPGRASYMFMLLSATDLTIDEGDWANFCLPQKAGPKRTAGAELSRQHTSNLKRLCESAHLGLSVRPWRLEGDITVDTRSLVDLSNQLEDALDRRQLRRSIDLVRRLRDCAPLLKEPDLHRSKWPLATLLGTIANTVPRELDARHVEEFKQYAVEVTGVTRLRAAMRAAKCELPARLFEWLLEEGRWAEAEEITEWIAPSFARSRGLERKLREHAERMGQTLKRAQRYVWVGMDGGPSHTALSAMTHGGPFEDTLMASGLGGAMSEEALVRSADGVMGRLEQVVGHDTCYAVVGCAGFDPGNPGAVLRALADARAHHRVQSELWVGNDGDLLLFAPPLLGNGVAVIADVGSVVVGRSSDGTLVRRGGDEWLLADTGSAYEIAVSTLRELLARADRHVFGGRLGEDAVALTRAARLVFGVPGPTGREPGAWCLEVMRRLARQLALRWDKSLVASFAHQVVRLAEEGNEIAASVIKRSGERLGRHLADVLSWHPDESPRIVIVGHLAMDSDTYFEALVDGARAQLRRIQRPTIESASAKLAGVLVPAMRTAVDARVENSAPLLAELARMLSITTVSELPPSEAGVVEFLRDERTSIVEHIPRA